MRLTPILALALALGSAGCVYIPLGKIPSLDVTSLASGTLTVKIKPTVTDGGYRTQAIITPWTRATIRQVILDVYKLDGATEKTVLQTVENTTAPYQIKLGEGQLDSEVPFKNLAPNTTYRIRARAYSSDEASEASLISDDKVSFLDIEVKTDDRPATQALPIKLLDKLFSGQASSPLNIENGEVRDIDESLELGKSKHSDPT